MSLSAGEGAVITGYDQITWIREDGTTSQGVVSGSGMAPHHMGWCLGLGWHHITWGGVWLTYICMHR